MVPANPYDHTDGYQNSDSEITEFVCGESECFSTDDAGLLPSNVQSVVFFVEHVYILLWVRNGDIFLPEFIEYCQVEFMNHKSAFRRSFSPAQKFKIKT